MVRGSWFVVRGSWFVVRGSWFVVRGSWFVVRGRDNEFAQQFRPRSFGLSQVTSNEPRITNQEPPQSIYSNTRTTFFTPPTPRAILVASSASFFVTNPIR